MKNLSIFMILILFTLTKTLFACADDTEYAKKNEILVWLGDNSLFSKAYKDGKCFLDKALVDLPLEQKRIIAKLIVKSYSMDIQSSKKVLNYNY